MVCDSSQKELTFAFQSEDECAPVVKVVSKNNCKILDINALWAWAKSNYWIVAIAMFVIGAFQWSLGQKMFKPTLFIIGLLSTLAIIMFVFYAWFLPYSTKPWTVWLIGSIAILLGLVVGFFFAKMARIGVCALGAWCGVVIALLVHETVMYNTHSKAVFWIMVVGIAAALGALALWKYKWVLIFGTAFIGSYFMVRAASLFIGGYPNEFTLIDDIKHGESKLHWPVYLYAIAIAVLFVGGVILQFRIKKRGGNSADKYDYYTRV
jgi:MFS family permease